MALPIILLNLDNEMYGFPDEGNLVYQYNPFQNLQNRNPITGIPDPSLPALGDLTMNSSKAGLNITEPITIDTEVSYDDSVNLIIIDNNVNPLKIVNSRFYQTNTRTYKVANRKGNLDTNIYLEDNFKIEASLIKSTRTISTLDFLGIKDGGSMKVGNYTFYFKLADADGNESDFIAESGRVVCHIGTINSPKSIRGGQLDENSYKLIKFRLNNLDLAYDYINIYYTRSTGSEDENLIKTYRINDKFKITNNNVEISITGYEGHEEISLADVNIQYTNFDSAKTLANCQNITFVGNTTNNYELFQLLEKYSLFVTPEVAYDEKGIGNLNYKYEETFLDDGFEYANAKNIYYKLGNWDEEIYRVGIVYILPDYTLSPVFNIRGRKQIGNSEIFTEFNLAETINFSEDYLIEDTINPLNPENAKGVFKISDTTKNIFNGRDSIKPIGLKFNFMSNVVDGNGFLPGLKDITKGFFIVRQKRISTILTQAVGIATSKNAKIPIIQGINVSRGILYNYFAESFLKLRSADPILGASLFSISELDDITHNALLCPEADLRRTMFNTFFNSSEYLLKEFKYKPSSLLFTSYDGDSNYVLKELVKDDSENSVQSELTLIEPGIELIRNSKFDFCSKAGDAIISYKHVDPILGNFEDPSNTSYNDNHWNNGISKVRGEFNTFIGTSADNLIHGRYYNVLEKNYNFEESWKDYFRIRYNDSSPYSPIGDRIQWSTLSKVLSPIWDAYTHSTDTFFRGDCYINTYTHRMHWNFIDPDIPTNKKVINPYTWTTNFKIKNKVNIKVDNDGGVSNTGLAYNKLLPIFTYKNIFEPAWLGDVGTTGDTNIEFAQGLLEPEDKKFKKYSERNGLFGTEKINRPDVNAVPLGHWVTFKICSNINLAMRDLDFSRPMEEAVHKQKRGFFPLQSIDSNNSLPESSVINSGISKSLGDKYYFEIPDVPFIKTNFATRIYYSNLLQSSAFTNGNRIFEANNYLDYTREYGSITKLIEWYGKLIVIFEHGVVMIPINERAMMQNATGENVYINTNNVLPKNPKVLSNTFGSLWLDSVIKTTRYIYFIDTVGKKICKTNGEQFEIISDLKVQKFLNDKIKLFESDKDKTINLNFVKTHFNAFKHDVLFVFKYNDIKWNLCWNELTQKWVTQYTWFPEFSENINNIFYTFANQSSHEQAGNQLYKHGFSGTEEEAGNIKPTNWYDEQHPFEYEFVIAAVPGVQKIFNTLKIISNLAEPDSFYYEIVGEGFNWFNDKDLITKLNDTELAAINGVSFSGIPTLKTEINVKARYLRYLSMTPSLKKLPYIYMQSFDVNDMDGFYRDRPILTAPFNMSVLRDLTIREHNRTKENLVNSYQKGSDLKKYGRIKGNMQYIEDSWDVQIQPIIFPYAYVDGVTLLFTPNIEMKIRDKYIKIRVKYKGDQYAIINALRTLFTISYA